MAVRVKLLDGKKVWERWDSQVDLTPQERTEIAAGRAVRIDGNILVCPVPAVAKAKREPA